MKIEFTKEQFEKLILLSSLGNLVVNSYREDEPLLEYEELNEYILSSAKEFGLSKMVVYNKESQEYLPSEEVQDEIVEILDFYDSNLFADDLVNTLSYRDMADKYGEDKIEAMSESEFNEKRMPFYKKYSEEFEDNGVDNLYIKG